MLNHKSWTSALIVIGIIVIVNLIASNVPGRFDLTKNDVYTMTSVTKNVLDNIVDPVTVKIFYSEKFPKELLNVQQYVFDMLNEYKNYAGSNLEYEFIEIKEQDSERKQEAQSLGIYPVQLNVAENDQFKMQQIYLGIVFQAGDKKELIPFTNKIEQLEYDFTGAIKRLSQGGKTKVAYLTGHGEISIKEANPYFQTQEDKSLARMNKAKEQIDEQFELVEIDLSKIDQIDPIYQIALWFEPTEMLTEKAKYAIDQFLVRGGKLAVLYNNNKIDFSSPVPVMPIRNGLGEFFSQYGIQFNDNIVVDEQNVQIQMQQRAGNFVIPVTVNYPFIPKLTHLDKENPIVNRLNELALFFPSSIDSVPGKNLIFKSLIKSSDKSGFAMKNPRSNMYDPNPQQFFDYSQKNITLAAFVRGKMQSAYEGKPDSIVSSTEHVKNSDREAVIVAVGDADFVKDEFNNGGPGQEFTLNMIDWLHDENGLISIRSKKIEIKPLDKEIMKAESAGTRDFIKAINVFLAPIIIIIFGVMRWLIRNKTKQLATMSNRG